MTKWQFEQTKPLRYRYIYISTLPYNCLWVRCIICWVIYSNPYPTKNTDSEVSEEGLTSNSINFIEEDQASLLSSGHLKELTHHPGSLHTYRTFPIMSRYLNLLLLFLPSMRLTSPTYFCTSSEPITLMKHASVLLATARAQRVFPVPGGPNSSTPFGGSMPRLTNLSGCKDDRFMLVDEGRWSNSDCCSYCCYFRCVEVLQLE